MKRPSNPKKPNDGKPGSSKPVQNEQRHDPPPGGHNSSRTNRKNTPTAP